MKNRPRITTHLFEIGFKGFYHEYSEHYTEHIKARNQTEALKRFYRKSNVRGASTRLSKRPGVKSATWEDGDWLMSLCYVKKVQSTVRHQCNGTGILQS
jgi:hypothetical protein